MKKLMILFLCLTMGQAAVEAQITYGIKLGISTPDIKPGDFSTKKFANGTDSFSLKINDANYGFHGGGWVRLKLGSVYLQPEVLFNTSKVQYNINKLKGPAIADSLKNERFNNLDVPIMLGFKVGSFRVNAGPVAHIRLGGDSDLATSLSDYKANFQSATWGYQAGIGLGFGKLGLDLRYEGNFTKFGGHISFKGSNLTLSTPDKAPSRLILSVAYTL